MNEFNLTQAQVQKVIGAVNDLKVQAMIFDMDIDIETWSLTPKRTDSQAEWLTRWKDKQSEADEEANSPGQNLGVE